MPMESTRRGHTGVHASEVELSIINHLISERRQLSHFGTEISSFALSKWNQSMLQQMMQY